MHHTARNPLAYFNPRPSYEERRGLGIYLYHSQHFNPRPSYEERPTTGSRFLPTCGISIHAPHTRSDTKIAKLFEELIDNFNPRPSYEERHRRLPGIHPAFPISIHAPHTRSDTAILSPLHFSSFHPPFSRTSSFPTSDISFLQQYLSSAFLCDSTSHASKESSALPDHRWSLRRYVLSFPYNSSRDDRTADCLFLHRWPFRAYAGIPRTVLCRGCIRKQNSALFVRDARRSLLLA